MGLGNGGIGIPCSAALPTAYGCWSPEPGPRLPGGCSAPGSTARHTIRIGGYCKVVVRNPD